MLSAAARARQPSVRYDTATESALKLDSHPRNRVRPTSGIAPASDVLQALRVATADRHAAVDGVMPLSRPSPTLGDYIDHLRHVRAWLHPMERWLAGSRVYSNPRFPQILQTPLIDADLTEAGLSSAWEDARIHLRQWPPHTSESYQWGARYVIEGSRLGAAVLFRRLSDALRPHALRYLAGNGGSTQRWPDFLRELQASVQTPSEIHEACEGACDSFDALLALCPLQYCSLPLQRRQS